MEETEFGSMVSVSSLIPKSLSKTACSIVAALLVLVVLVSCANEDVDASSTVNDASEKSADVTTTYDSSKSNQDNEGPSDIETSDSQDSNVDETAVDGVVDAVVIDPYDFGEEEAIPEGNLLDGEAFEAAVNGDSNAIVIDGRTPVNFSAMVFPWESLNIPVNQIVLRDREFLDAPMIYVMANDNKESSRAYQAIIETGYPQDQIVVLNGGLNGWLLEGREVGVPTLSYGC